MRESTNSELMEKDNGDMVWTIWDHMYLKWLNIDERAKPVDKFVHPVLYETGARKQTILENKLRKAEKKNNINEVEQLERKLEEYQSAQSAKKTTEPSGNDYHWSSYEECIVTYKKKQTRKAVNELQLTVKIRTRYLGCGDPKANNGYLGGGCGSSDLLDPESEVYRLMKSIGR